MKKVNELPVKQDLIKLFSDEHPRFTSSESEALLALRNKAIKLFEQKGFPEKNDENWRNTDLIKMLGKSYSLNGKPGSLKMDAEELFECKIHDFDTEIISLLNGWHVYKDKPLLKMEDGTVMGSLAAAVKEYPELIEKHYGKIFKLDQNGFVSLNTALAQDGIFIYIPDNVEVSRPVQMISIINKNSFIQNRNLINFG